MFAAAIGIVLVVTIAATWIHVAASGRIVDDDAVAPGSTIVVFGSLVRDGAPGDYVRGRLDSAIDLYRQGKVARIINSGNGTEDAGDEPRVMRTYLEARGVPSSIIVDDPAGMDTEATCRRIGRLDADGRRPVVLITQDFHAGRAVALCRRVGIDAVAVEAGCECAVWTQVRNHLREALLARPRALVSLVTGI